MNGSVGNPRRRNNGRYWMKCVAILWTSEDLRSLKPEEGRREIRKEFLVIQDKEIKVRSASHGSLHFHTEVGMVRQRPLEKQNQTCWMRGGARHAVEDGTETAAIQKRGRWRNPRSMSPYVSTSTEQPLKADQQGYPAIYVLQCSTSS
ncbi:hypothetical protein Aduo_018799 [Ancylostoma duodenale]